MQMCFFITTPSAGETIYHTQSEKESLQVTKSSEYSQSCHMSQLVPKYLNITKFSKDILRVLML
jgi:hypothetical protein